MSLRAPLAHRRIRLGRLAVGCIVTVATIAVPLSRQGFAAPVLGLTNTANATLPLGHAFTTRDPGGFGATDAIDSDADRTTGDPANFVLDETLPLVTSADGTVHRAGNILRDIDAGIHPVYSLGDTVWHDLNGDSVRNDGEPRIDGVSVGLFASSSTGDPTGTALAFDTTSNDGAYLFTTVPAGDYVVVIGAAQFGPGTPLARFHSSGTSGTVETTSTLAESGIDLDDNGTRMLAGPFYGSVASSTVTLGPSANEPTGEPATPGRTDTTPDAQSNLTVDFGFVSMSLGNLVWIDTDNNGVRNGNEVGIAGVPVRIYRDDDRDGRPDAAELASTATDAHGEYLFTGLAPGRYVVEITAPAAHESSTGNLTGYTGPYEPGKGDDLGADSADHGTTVGNVIRSGTITLAPATEPGATIETTGISPTFDNPATDANTDLTVDFGLVPAASIGNYVWLDSNRNGLQDESADAGINGITVRLSGPDERPVRTTTTTSGPDGQPGYYRFDVLPGNYHVGCDLTTLPDGFIVSPRGRSGDDAHDSDGDPITGNAEFTNLAAGEFDPTWDLGIYPTVVVIGNQDLGPVPVVIGVLVESPTEPTSTTTLPSDPEPGIPSVGTTPPTTSLVPVAPVASLTPPVARGPVSGVQGDGFDRELAFTGPSRVAILARLAMLLLALGLVASAVVRRRPRSELRSRQ